MTQLPAEPGLPDIPTSAPPVDRDELHAAIRFIEEQGKNRQGYVNMSLGCQWGFFALILVIFLFIRFLYQTAVESGDPLLIQSFPFPPPILSCALIALGLCIVIGVCFHLLASNTRNTERYEIRERLEHSTIAADLKNNRLDFARIYRRTKAPSCLWWLAIHSKAKTQSEKQLSILAENLHLYLGYRPATLLADEQRWVAWDYGSWIGLMLLIPIWYIAGWGGIENLSLLVNLNFFIQLIKSVPAHQLEAVNCQELARYLRGELGFSPDD